MTMPLLDLATSGGVRSSFARENLSSKTSARAQLSRDMPLKELPRVKLSEAINSRTHFKEYPEFFQNS